MLHAIWDFMDNLAVVPWLLFRAILRSLILGIDYKAKANQSTTRQQETRY